MKKRIVIAKIGAFCLVLACNSGTNQKELVENATTDILIKTVESTNSYVELEPTKIAELNAVIQSKNLKTNEEIVRYYIPESLEKEGKYSYTITPIRITSNLEIVTLVEDYLMDDSHKAKKVLFYIETSGQTKKVNQIKTAFKCWENRGHQEWAADPCK